MRFPMASDVGVMVHIWLLLYANGKLGERMQLLAAGSTVQRPEMMVKCGGGGVVYGGGGERDSRVPQSKQSVPYWQSRYWAPGPPSSQ
jgi:hypothetical protein